MSIRTEGDFVAASNGARELSNLVARFLTAYRKYANGANGVNVPEEDFTVVLNTPVLGAGDVVMVSCALVFKQTTKYEVPTCFEPDDDEFNERLGANNVSGYEIRSESSIETHSFLIPCAALLLSDEAMWKYLVGVAEAHAKKQSDEAKAREIKTLRERLAALENTEGKAK